MVETALILGNYRPSYILARTLTSRGYSVICGMDGYDRGAEVSRYVSAIWDHPKYVAGSNAFQQSLDAFCRHNPSVKLLFPVTEDFVKAFADEKLSVPHGVRLGSMAHETVRHCLDKPRLLTLARELDIPVAPFAVTSNLKDLKQSAAGIGFPIVARPLSSTVRLNGKKAVICQSLDTLIDSYATWQADNQELLLQRFVTGKRDNIYFAAHQGTVFRYLHAKIERTDQPDGSGLALEGVTIDPCPVLEGYVQKLIKALNYSGIGCVQFLVDEARGQNFLLEINPRIAGNHALPEFAGLDLGGCLTDLALSKNRAAELSYGRANVRYTWLAGECESIRARWRAGHMRFSEMLKALVGATSAWLRSDLDMAIGRNDWKPGVVTLCDSLPIIGRFTRRRFQRGLVQTLLLRKDRLRS